MKLLFRREQDVTIFGRVYFKLWGKLEPDEEEQRLIDTYQMNNALIIDVWQPLLLRYATGIGFAAFFLSSLAFLALFEPVPQIAIGVGLVVGPAVGYWWYNQNRETIYIKDLLHGRQFSCKSIVDLVKKEAELEGVVGALRQVMESAKHWDGTEEVPIDALPKAEAKQFVRKLSF